MTLSNEPHTTPSHDEQDENVLPVLVDDVIAGKYRIGSIVGFGGMATVVAAHHLELDQPVAIKFLDAAAAARPEAVRRFVSEARAAARLNSPHVARVLDVGTTETTQGGVVPYLVMELLEGMDLDAVLERRGRLPVEEAVEYVLQACAGVAEAHALAIIHRDLKPGNLFVTRRRDGAPVVKLLDFGISKNIAPKGKGNADTLTADRDMMGSPRYMSPEQVRSSKHVDVRTDIWSLGVILHELVAGAPPFEAETIADTLVAILHSPPRPIARTAPEVPEELVAIVMRCLMKDRDARYASVDELARDLASFRDSHAHRALPSLLPATLAPAPSRASEPTLDARHVEAGFTLDAVRALPRRHAVLTVAVSVGAVALGLLAFVAGAPLRAATPPAALDSPVRAVVAVPLAPAAPAAPAAPPAPEPEVLAAVPLALAPVVDPVEVPAPKPTTSATPTPTSAPTTATAPQTHASRTRHRTDW